MIATLAPVVLATWERTPPTFAVRPDQAECGERVARLRHRRRHDAARASTSISTSLTERCVICCGRRRRAQRPTGRWSGPPRRRPAADWSWRSARRTPLDLWPRPDTEPEADYLDALRPLLDGAAAPVAADLAMVTCVPPNRRLRKRRKPRPAHARPEKCANIVSRAQLGETLSDAELAALRTECRS